MQSLRGNLWACLLAIGLAAAAALAAEPDSTTSKPETAKARQPPFSIVRGSELGRSLTATLDACDFDGSASHQSPPSPPAASAASGTEGPHSIKYPRLEYPISAQLGRQQGAVLIEMLIGIDGYARFVHATRSLPATENTGFVAHAISAARYATFAPARKANLPVAAWWRIKFSYGSSNILNDDAVRKLLNQAASGDPASIVGISYLDTIERQQVGLTHEARRDYLVYAALAGERWARLDVDRVLRQESCDKPPPVTGYLRATVWQGDSELELAQATQFLERNDPADRHTISVLLHGAANGVDPFVQLWAAGILATAPDVEIRDAVAALAAVRDMKDDGYPEFQELLAAAAAANGDFAAAVSAEQLALQRAARFHWDSVRMRERLASYQAQHPWTGYLCDCTVLVPGAGS